MNAPTRLPAPPTREQAFGAVETLLRYIEQQALPLREGICETPERVVNSYLELFSGYGQDPDDYLKLFQSDTQGQSIILVKDIEFSSTCEHHMLPFMGVAHIAYIPGPSGKVLGVSKLARLLEVFAKRLQIQERIGDQVVDALFNGVPDCSGAACILDSRHLCMTCRGVKKQHSSMVTSSLRGVFMTERETRAELMAMIG